MVQTLRITRRGTFIAPFTLALFVFASGASAATGERIIHDFTGGTGGAHPQIEPLKKGNDYYGVTVSGGGSTNCEGGCGTVYRLSGREVSILHAFKGGDNGYAPVGPLIVYNQEFYGTTYYGGANDLGTIYKLSGDGTYTVLYSFVGGTQGLNPYGKLVADAEGSIYGLASGGVGNCFGGPCGTVYKLTAAGEYSVLHAFDPLKGEGTSASYGLVKDSEGNFYGTTTFGGTGSGDQCSLYGCGTIYKITPEGVITFIRNFEGGVVDGSKPYGGLTIDANDNLYGTTYEGGGFEDNTGLGTVYKLTPTGQFTILHSFHRNGADAVLPYIGVSLDAQGNLYGASYYGGANGDGAIFKVTPNGHETILYSFSQPNGDFPSRPVPAARNSLIGVTDTGGANNFGTIYQLNY